MASQNNDFRVPKFFASSHLPGSASLDLQEEIGCVSKAVGHALDDLDAVIDAFEDR